MFTRSIQHTNLKNVLMILAFTAAAVILPLIIHVIAGQSAGRLYLPMQLFVFLAGLMLGSRSGLAVGILTPLISFSLSGMPTVSMLPLIIVELALYGTIAGYLHHDRNWSIFSSLITAMIVGRIVLLIFSVPYVISAVQSGIIGIAIQLVLIPIIFHWAEKFNGETL